MISGGVNIYPAEVEAALQQLTGVADCAVFGIPDEEFGEALAATVELLPGYSRSGAEIREALADLQGATHRRDHAFIATRSLGEDSQAAPA